MRGGIIYVKGNVGPFAGVHMRGGTIVVKGNVGIRIGAEMIGGTIVVLGKLEEILPSFSYKESVPEVKVEDRIIEGPFLRFVGDLVEDGKGNLFLLSEKNRHLL
jgi:formylmethanofuran dehydrogenase subunit C